MTAAIVNVFIFTTFRYSLFEKYIFFKAFQVLILLFMICKGSIFSRGIKIMYNYVTLILGCLSDTEHLAVSIIKRTKNIQIKSGTVLTANLTFLKHYFFKIQLRIISYSMISIEIIDHHYYKV